MSKTARRLVISLIFGICVSFIVLLLSKTTLLKTFELYTYDYRFRLHGQQKSHPDIVLIGIDDECQRVLGKGCWQVRRNHAHMLEYLSKHLPRVVGFDFLFKGKETNPDLVKHDEELLQVINYFDPGIVCMAYNFIFKDNQQNAATDKEIELLERFEIKNVSGDLSQFEYLEDVDLPFEELAEIADLGFINAPRDIEAGIRKLPMIMGLKVGREEKDEKHYYPSLSLLMACRYLQVPLNKVEVEMGKEIRIPKNDGGKIRVPIDKSGYMIINFVAEHRKPMPPGMTEEEYFNLPRFETVSFAQLIEFNRVDSDTASSLIEDKLLLVGLTVTGSTDQGATPLAPDTPLVTVHLNAINSILTGKFVYISPEWVGIMIILLISIGLGVCNGSLSPVKSTMTTVIAFIFYLFTSYFIFARMSFIIPVIPPVVAIVLIYSSMIFYRFLTEERQKIWIRKALGRYLAPNVMQEVLRNPDQLRLGGIRKNLTVLFSDIVGFTPICEKLQPEEVVQLLNEYLGKMTECIFRHSGTLDKYVGDEIVAFFGAPGEEHADDHATHAILAALDMRDELYILQQKWESEGKQKIQCGIGINTGEMLIGNMGSTDIFDYTVIGDEVNLGARVEQLTRVHGYDIIITESTYNHVKDIIEAKELGIEKVKGKERGVRIFAVLGRKQNPETMQ